MHYITSAHHLSARILLLVCMLAYTLIALPQTATAQSGASSQTEKCNTIIDPDALLNQFLGVAATLLNVPVFDRVNLEATIDVIANTSVLPKLWEKECVIDPNARAAAKATRDAYLREGINWIDTGYKFQSAADIENNSQGTKRPVYVQNTPEYLTEIDERTRELFLNDNNIPDDHIFADNILAAIKQETDPNETPTYTLDDVTDDPEAFVSGESTEGGFEAFHELFTNPANNPFTVAINARRELTERTQAAREEELRQLEYGRGFFPQRNERGEVTTPASIVQNTTAGITEYQVTELLNVDEANELIGNAVGQVTKQIFEGKNLGDIDPISGSGFPVKDPRPIKAVNVNVGDITGGIGDFLSGGLQGMFDFIINNGLDFALDLLGAGPLGDILGSLIGGGGLGDLLNAISSGDFGQLFQDLLNNGTIADLLNGIGPGRFGDLLQSLVNGGGFGDIINIIGGEGVGQIFDALISGGGFEQFLQNLGPEAFGDILDLVGGAGGLGDFLDAIGSDGIGTIIDIVSGSGNGADIINTILGGLGVNPQDFGSVGDILEAINNAGVDLPISPDDINPDFREILEQLINS